MGIIELVLLLVTLFVVLLVFAPLTLVIIKLFQEDSIIRKLGFFPLLIFLMTFSWVVFNFSSVVNYMTMASTSDNGWTVYKTTDGIDGLYIEFVGYGEDSPFASLGFYMPEYNEVETYRGGFNSSTGKPDIRVESKGQPKLKNINQRALTYGIRSKREIFQGIFRVTNTLMNFDNGEVFAKEIYYQFKDVKPDQNWVKLSRLVTYHPQGNSRLNEQDMKRKYLEVFKPRL